MDDLAKIFTVFIPIIAIVGGIILAIVRVFTQARLEELARKERIAAIERGVDPDKIATLVGTTTDSYALGDSRLRRAHGLLIGSFILIAVGIGLTILFYVIEPREHHWVIGLIPTLVGLALLAGSMVVWPRGKQ